MTRSPAPLLQKYSDRCVPVLVCTTRVGPRSSTADGYAMYAWHGVRI